MQVDDKIAISLLCAYCWWCGYQAGATRFLSRAIKHLNTMRKQAE